MAATVLKTLIKKIIHPLVADGLLYPSLLKKMRSAFAQDIQRNDFKSMDIIQGETLLLITRLFEDAKANDKLSAALMSGVINNKKLTLKLLKSFKVELNIVLGASSKSQEGWIPTEIEFLDITNASNWEELFNPDSILKILAEHVWEHLAQEEGITAARHCFQYLKRGGHIRVAVPDGLHPSPEYIDYVKPGGTGAGSDDHKVLYTYKTFRQVFESAGFAVRLIEYWDEDGQFHFYPWDIRDGFIERSSDHDERNREKELSYTSLILDGIKDE